LPFVKILFALRVDSSLLSSFQEHKAPPERQGPLDNQAPLDCRDPEVKQVKQGYRVPLEVLVLKDLKVTWVQLVQPAP